jgi:aminoglycoside phosphotransferase (APT) family kinase protein
MATVVSSADSTSVRAGLEFDAGALSAWMRDNVSGGTQSWVVRQFKGGQSNPTYLLDSGQAKFVLRRKPPGALLASAHAVDREYRVLAALGRTNVPVPKVHGLCMDRAVIGTEFYVMDFVAGRVFWDTAFPDVLREDRPRYFDALNSALAALHNVDYQAVGLGDFGRAQGYVARQIARWSKQYVEDEPAGRVPAMDELIPWLRDHVPQDDAAAIVHGDYRCDNVVFHPREPRVLAILDWELSTIGHPVADFAYHAMMYRMPSLAIPGLLDKDVAALNIPSEAEYVAAYCRRTGRSALPDLDFYIVFCLFRLAAIFHGIRGRVARGTAVSARAADYAARVEVLAELALKSAKAMRG